MNDKSDDQMVNISGQEAEQEMSREDCLLQYQNYSRDSYSGMWCSPAWDTFYCWPPTPAGSVLSRTCDEIFKPHNISTFDSIEAHNSPLAYRECDYSGQWLWGNWTNYTECVNYEPPAPELPIVRLFVGYILFIFSILSLITLLVTLFIFFYFKSLMCSRLRVHRNLVVALIIHSILLTVISLPPLFKISSYQGIEWLCKFVVSLKLYAALACINWMFIEGLLLHSRITISIFRKDAPFKLYYCVGWGLPLLIIIVWSTTMSNTLPTSTAHCWKGYGESVYVWMITGPMITAIGINCIFLINIIRILITKLRLTVTVEMTQIRKAIKATALLFPLLGISHLLFCFNPGDNGQLESAYMITNAFLQSSQGIFVSILYCFLNSEVQTVIRNVFLRASMRRNPNMKFSFIRQNSSNRRFRFQSQTSASFVSNWEAGPHQCADNKITNNKLELDELKPNQSTKELRDIESKKSFKKSLNNSSPQSRKCLIYTGGQLERARNSIVIKQNGTTDRKH